MLPNFLLIGAPKAGTTTLAAYLDAHPQVYVAREKEVHFFDLHYDRGTAWYESRFDGAGGRTAVGEASPTYMLTEESVARMAELLPDAKLIALLRNPVDRAYSHYWWMHAMFEQRSFAEAVRDDIAGRSSRYTGYVDQGRYLEQLERVSRYYPPGSLHVMILEHLNAAPAERFADVCRFLGIDDRVVPPKLGAVLNTAYRLRWPWIRKLFWRYRLGRRFPRFVDRVDRLNRARFTYPPMEPAVRAELEAYFDEHNAALGEWLGQDLSAWSASAKPARRADS